ncbi:MAG TPA: hypothetical protein VF139_16615 [Candidatus Polarisedimenticolaceae bacterium]
MSTVKEKEVREMLPVEQLERMLPNIAWNYWVELNKLRNEAVQALHLHATIVDKPGMHINVGERFKVEFTLWLGPLPNCPTEELGLPLYRDVTATIKGTTYAKPVTGTTIAVPMTNVLTPGMPVVRKTIEFEALKAFPGDPATPEIYVETRLEADFDIARFFHVVNNQVFTTNIFTT